MSLQANVSQRNSRALQNDPITEPRMTRIRTNTSAIDFLCGYVVIVIASFQCRRRRRGFLWLVHVPVVQVGDGPDGLSEVAMKLRSKLRRSCGLEKLNIPRESTEGVEVARRFASRDLAHTPDRLQVSWFAGQIVNLAAIERMIIGMRTSPACDLRKGKTKLSRKDAKTQRSTVTRRREGKAKFNGTLFVAFLCVFA